MKILKLIMWPIVFMYVYGKELCRPLIRASKKTNGILFGYAQDDGLSLRPPRFIDPNNQHRHRRGHRGGKKHHKPNRETRW